jgi:hypothetical protein
MVLALALLELPSPPGRSPAYLRDEYLDLVHKAKSEVPPTNDYTNDYRDLIEKATDAYVDGTPHQTGLLEVVLSLSAKPQKAFFDYSAFNANDFANIHRVAWLVLGRALTSLTNLNPHGDWGDPPPNGSAHPDPHERPFPHGKLEQRGPRSDFELLNYHYVPNLTGYYAVSSSDLVMPNPGT